jgi:glycine/D-amino acid oxidase-like deaminating enzyme/nitrite reductase/ring-hydroxylating ferredoxin subunit
MHLAPTFCNHCCVPCLASPATLHGTDAAKKKPMNDTGVITGLASAPYWLDPPAKASFPALAENIETEVLVIGGGITGVTTAWLLAREGRQVTLVERETIGARDSGHTTAHLTYMTDTRLSELIATFSRKQAQLAWQAGQEAMKLIRDTIESLSIDCDFAVVPGYLAAAEEADQSLEGVSLRHEADLVRELGFNVEMDGVNPITASTAIVFPDQMRFHPLKYLRALAHDAAKRGARIFENTEVNGFEDDPQRVTAAGHDIRYQRVVIATHVPLQGSANTLGAALFQSKLALYSTYAIAARIPAASVKELIWSDTADPFHYLRIEQHGDSGLAIFGGEDHKTGKEADTAACFTRLEERLACWLPEAVVTHRWSGQVVETVDGLPFIGEAAENQFIATGFSGNGYTFGTAAAIMARDWASGTVHPWSAVFDPGRKSAPAIKEYLKENADYPVHMVRDRLKTPEGNPSLLEPGEGRVMEFDGDRIAAYRDPEGEVHVCSAICPHLGCIVAWNPAEQTWDCPCHGSRFTATGKVIAGPAESDLKQLPARQP